MKISPTCNFIFVGFVIFFVTQQFTTDSMADVGFPRNVPDYKTTGGAGYQKKTNKLTKEWKPKITAKVVAKQTTSGTDVTPPEGRRGLE